MTNRILIVGLACLSAVAVAQSDGSQQKTASPSQHEVTSPRDAATGQASGKRMHKPVTVTTDDATAREVSTVKATGKAAEPAKPAVVRVAAGDVNGDGKADVVSHEVKSPRDLATGQASGKQAAPSTGTVKQDKKDEVPAHK